MPEHVYIEFRIEMEVKSILKGKRVLLNIEQKLEKTLLIEEIYRSDKNEHTASCYIEMGKDDTSKLITETLLIIDRIGHKWLVRNPNLNYTEYWEFRGERMLEIGKFRVNGIKAISFTLTNYKRTREGILVKNYPILNPKLDS